jgi:subtilisin family serine protease
MFIVEASKENLEKLLFETVKLEATAFKPFSKNSFPSPMPATSTSAPTKFEKSLSTGKEFQIVPLGENAVVTDHPEILSRAKLSGARVLSSRQFSANLPAMSSGAMGAASKLELADSWAIDRFHISSLRKFGLDGRNIKIGIIDSGVDFSHPVFAENSIMKYFKSHARFSTDPKSDGELLFEGDPSNLEINGYNKTFTHDHGTHTAGILCASGVKGIGQGVAPASEVYVACALDEQGNLSTASIYAALKWMQNFNLDILSLSLGWWGFRDHWAEPIQQLLDQGCAIYCASGNEFDAYHSFGRFAPTRSPGNYPFWKMNLDSKGFLFSVGATNSKDETWKSSGGGRVTWPETYVDEEAKEGPRKTFFYGTPEGIVPLAVAPGDDIVGPVPGDSYYEASGTSQATPFMAGLAALVLQSMRNRDAAASARQASELLVQTMTDGGQIGADERFGLGYPDIDKLMVLLQLNDLASG